MPTTSNIPENALIKKILALGEGGLSVRRESMSGDLFIFQLETYSKFGKPFLEIETRADGIKIIWLGE